MMRAEPAATLRSTFVEVQVPPGPLGILLDDAGPGGGAFLDGFAPVGTNEDEVGAVQASGRVPKGSTLVAVNEYELEAEGMTFAEIGQVLRDTSHLARVLRFRVEVPAGLDVDDEDEDDSDEEELDSDEVEEVTDDDEEQEEEEAEDEEMHKVDAAMGVTTIDSASSSAPNGSTRQNSPSAVSNSSHGSWTPVRASTASSASQKPIKGGGGSPAHVPTTAIDTAAGRFGADTSLSLSPPSLGTIRPEDSFATSSSPTNDQDEPTNEQASIGELVRVEVPAGPLGLNLDGGLLDRAVVLGFVPIRDGDKGPVELHGGVVPGSRLVHVDERDVTGLTLNEIRVLLGERSSQPRTLEFRLPSISSQQVVRPSVSASARLPSFTSLVEDLSRRRKLEVALIMKYDTATIKRGQCWFMISTAWLARWIEFAAKDGELPGPITNEVLLEDEWHSRRHSDEAGRPDVPREGLVLSKDYRGVSPMVWCLFAELHGLGEAPLLPRYLLDIYAAGLSEKELSSILQEPRLKAVVLANELRDTCLVRQSK